MKLSSNKHSSYSNFQSCPNKIIYNYSYTSFQDSMKNYALHLVVKFLYALLI